MTHVSASAFCVWSVMSCALGAFLIGHLWRFDRFKCLRWSNSPYSGAFKRLMTYTYLLTVPLITAYCFGFTYMKYREGWMVLPEGSVVPKPYFLWPDSFQKAIFPLNMVFSFGWSFELITHLEELCFWLFLMNTGSRQPDWFRSPFFRFWAVGSVFAFVYVPLITILYRENPLSCEAHMFLAGSIGDLVLTVAFVPILIKFPAFLLKVKAEGVDTSTMVRLRKFHELNIIRVIFRVLFSVPLLSLGIDGVKGHTHHLNESMFGTDLLIIITALGCAFSSMCTLLIFFPRSYEAEYQAQEASIQRGTQSPRQSRSQTRSGGGGGGGGGPGDRNSEAHSHSSRLSIRAHAHAHAPRLQLPKRRRTTSAERAVGPADGRLGGVSAQLAKQVPIEMQEQEQEHARGRGGKSAPRPLPAAPGGRGAARDLVRADSAAPTFLLTDSPIAASDRRRSLDASASAGANVGVSVSVNSAGLETDADPFNPPPIAVTMYPNPTPNANADARLNPFLNHPYNARAAGARRTHGVDNANANDNDDDNDDDNSGRTPASIHAPLHVDAHPASYYEGEDKYNEFGYEVEYDPWTDTHGREDVKVDLDKDLEPLDVGGAQGRDRALVAGLPRMAYASTRGAGAGAAQGVQAPLPAPMRERARSRAINFSRPMRGAESAGARALAASGNTNTNGNGGGNALGLTLENVQRHNVAESDINPLVHSFMSPLDVFERPTPRNTPRHSPRQSWV